MDVPKAQRERVDEFSRIASLSKSFDEASLQLDDLSSDAVKTILANASEQTSAPDAELLFNSVLKDRRVARIYGFLRELPIDVARAKCLEMYQQKLQLLKDAWNRVAPRYKPADVMVGSPKLYWRHHSVCASVFLISLFCPAADVDNTCRGWSSEIMKAVSDSGVDHAAYERNLGVPIRDVFPDQLFLLNIYAVVAHQNKCDLHSGMPEGIEIPSAGTASFLRWDADLGAKEQGSNVLVSDLPHFRGWGGVAPGAARENVLLHVREKLRGCGLLKTE